MKTPPKLLIWLLDALCPANRPDLKGDFLELYENRAVELGQSIANKKFFMDVLSVIPLKFIIKEKLASTTSLSLLRNDLFGAYRSLVRHRVFSLINLTGLTLGIASSLLLFQYVNFEFSYDRFHTNAPNIYRIRLDSYKSGAFQYSSAQSYHSESPALKEAFPQVLNYVRLHRADGMLNYYDKNGQTLSYFEQNGLYVDSSFFSIFSFPLIKGNRNSVLKNGNSMLMSESASKKYFGNGDPIGKVLSLKTEWESGEYVVEGIFKDVTENSHVKFDFLFSIEKLLVNQQFMNGGWYWMIFHNYLLVRPGKDVKELESGISSVINTHLASELRSANSVQKFVLQPLSDIHLHSNLTYEIDTNGNYQLVYFIVVIALLIMGIACLNYLNLSTAKSMERAKEVGIRKIMGSKRWQLIKQFLFESFLLMTIAIVLAVLLLFVLKPSFKELIGNDITADLFEQKNFWIAIGSVLSICMFLSALYPAIVLSSFQPISALKGKFIGSGRGERIRKMMVVFQFTASILLIIGTLTIGKQITFLQDLDLGMNVNQKLIIRAPRILKGESYLNEMSAFKNLLAQHPVITSIASSSEVPGRPIFWGHEFKLTQNPEEDKREFSVLSVDEDFIPTYGITLLAGRNFSNERPADFGGPVIINETAMAMLGIKDAENAIGQEIENDFSIKKIVGVIKDFHQESLKKSDLPIILYFIPWHNDYLTVSMNSQNVRADVEMITETYKKVFPGNAIEYFFLDDFYNRQYKSDMRFWNIFKIFSVLAIFIACTGIFGLSSLLISKRTKEVGIRKVLGSSEIGIVVLLSKDFLKLVFIAFLLSVPMAMFIMDKWLEGFAHRITIPMWIYLLSGGLALVIAMFTISFQAIRVALANPTKAIQCE